MSKPTILKQKVYIPSASEYDNAREKFPAFMGAKLSKKAKQDGAWENSDYNAGYFFLRTALACSSSSVFAGSSPGTRGWPCTDIDYAGLRVAFNLIYNPSIDLARGCRMETRTAVVYNPDTEKDETVTSTAPIVKFGKYDCIWLNKEECEAAYARGETAVMKFWTLDLVAKAERFSEDGSHNDYGKAEKLRAQCESMFTKKELAQMVEVEMSSEDGYETATPILENQDTAVNTEESEIHKLFAQVAAGEMDEEGLRKALKEIVAAERVKPEASTEKAKALAEEINQGFEWLKKKKEANAIYDEINANIDNFKLGGEDESE